MQNITSNNCPLCNSSGDVFYSFKKRLHYQCNNCSGIYVDESLRLNSEEEKSRYEKHNNDVENKGYQKFVSPITTATFRDFTQKDKGLDFGAGTGPVISKILKDNGYSIVQYDPFFHNHPEMLESKYDYIACCEVIEHFLDPKKEFLLLNNMLQLGGLLYCMTDVYEESIDFHKWYYKNDDTHVFIYHKNTIEWIKKEIGFSKVTIEGRLISFSK